MNLKKFQLIPDIAIEEEPQWVVIEDTDVVAWTCSDCCVMVGIKGNK